MEMSLKDKRAIVCGSTQGIGKAIAMELARLGAHITLIARDGAKLIQVVGELDASEGQWHDTITADFSDSAALKMKIHAYLVGKSPCHILVNNTGGPSKGPITQAKEEEFTAAFSKHLVCNHLLVQAVLPGMKTAGYGRIINVISTSVKQPIPGLGVSNTIRAAVANWAKTLAAEVAPFGITVNNILPGYTKTARLGELIAARAMDAGVTEEQETAKMVSDIPMGRLGTPEEIAAAAAFLSTPAASYITGINLPVDGGRLSSL